MPIMYTLINVGYLLFSDSLNTCFACLDTQVGVHHLEAEIMQPCSYLFELIIGFLQKGVTIQWTGLLNWNTGLTYFLHVLWLVKGFLLAKGPSGSLLTPTKC